MVVDTSTLLRALLQGVDASERERAWEQFVSAHSRLILHAIRRNGGSHDDVMDRYAYVLEQLRVDDFRRLRTWVGRGNCRLTTWLVVVVNRLCTDHLRRQYGRNRGTGTDAVQERQRRRRLVEFVAEELQQDAAGADADGEPGGHAAEARLRAAELHDALAGAVSQLPPADQLLLTLRFRDALSAAQIARAMSLPTPFHVYRRLNQLFETMRRALRTLGVEDPVP
jgi:RNA polymerase sigma factor (sigma-70 family)